MNIIRSQEWYPEARRVGRILEQAPTIDKRKGVGIEEFKARYAKVWKALRQADLDAAIVYSDEHYHGDVPYLGGNTNISVEPVAGVIGKHGFHIMAGLEGGYVAEQLAGRSGATVHKVEMLKLADEDYPVEAERVEDVIEAAAGCRPERIGLLTPREVLPVAFFDFLSGYLGGREHLVNAQVLYQRVKYEKSVMEMSLIADAGKIADTMLRGMLAVLKPGMLETQVAQWGYLIAREMGAESMGFDLMVTANTANRSLIGKALNRPIAEGDYVHLGVGPERDGLNACERCTVIAVDRPEKIFPDQRFWLNFVADAFKVGLDAYKDVAIHDKPARLQEQALVDYFESRAAEVSRRLGKPVDLVRQKPYTGTHNSGYTECQEFYGAITLNSNEPLGRQIVTMLDVAIRGTGNRWDEIVIPGMDYVVVEKTLGKFGRRVELLTELPVDLQPLVGAAS